MRFALRMWALVLAGAGLCISCGDHDEHAEHVRGLPVAAANEDSASALGEGTDLAVDSEMLRAARHEAEAMQALPAQLRVQSLRSARAAHSTPDYESLQTSSVAERRPRVFFRGPLISVGPAGRDWWIMAMRTRQTETGWTDPVYVLSPQPLASGAQRSVLAQVDGHLVGLRTIGQHRLPLILAFWLTPEPLE